jgi:hypothetical protein
MHYVGCLYLTCASYSQSMCVKFNKNDGPNGCENKTVYLCSTQQVSCRLLARQRNYGHLDLPHLKERTCRRLARKIRWIGFRSGDGATPLIDAYLRARETEVNHYRKRRSWKVGHWARFWRGSADQLPFSLNLLCVDVHFHVHFSHPSQSFLSCNFFRPPPSLAHPPYPRPPYSHPPSLSLQLKRK